MTVALTSNFLRNARGITFKDAGVTWAMNGSTNEITGSASGSSSSWPVASGFGTPTGASVVTDFDGTGATTAQMQATIAEILAVLKAAGMIAA
jgi:hypothetical protein